MSEQTRSLLKALSILIKAFDFSVVGIVIILIVSREFAKRILPVVLLLLTLIAGCIAFINRKLPDGNKAHVKISRSMFGIHPYVTFAALII